MIMAIKICLDAGHFGKYNRSNVYPSYYESDMTWKLHLLLKKELEKYGIEVITTRDNKDIDLALDKRGAKSKGCDLFLSLHSNACDTESVDRAVVIPYQDVNWTDIDDVSRAIAERLGACVTDVMGLSSYQIYPRKSGNDRDGNGKLDDEYYGVLYGSRKVGTPGLILEHGFHTNTKCAKWLSDDNNLGKLAKAEADVIADYFGIKKEKEWYADAQKWAVDNGIADGTRPDEPATRAEVWTMLKRLKEKE
jgi:N-acetylmuramoyl-L-alanine amidase